MRHKLAFIFLFSTILIPGLMGQDLSIAITDTNVSGQTGEELVVEGKIFNLSIQEKVISLIRETNDLPAGWSSSLCIDLCYSPLVSQITDTLAGGDSTDFSIHFFTNDEAGEGRIRISIGVERGTKTYFDLSASTTTTAITAGTGKSHPTFYLMGNYPNPFNGSTVIQFFSPQGAQSGRLGIFDSSGRTLFTKQVNNLSNGINRIRVRESDFEKAKLSSGVYFYFLSVNSLSGAHHAYGKFTYIK